MKSKLCILFCRTAIGRKQFAYLYAALRSISIAGLNTLLIITFFEKLAFQGGVALRITKLYAKKCFNGFCARLHRVQHIRSISPALRRSKRRYICDTGWNTLPVFISKTKRLALRETPVYRKVHRTLVATR